MQDVPYHKWIAKTKQYLPIGSSILNVGCGTGTISILLAKEGYNVTGNRPIRRYVITCL